MPEEDDELSKTAQAAVQHIVILSSGNFKRGVAGQLEEERL